MSNHYIESDEIVGDRYIVTCACGKTFENEANQEGSDHAFQQMAGHRLGSSSEDDEGEGGQRLNVSDAADIWLSHGMDEDYRSGYSDDELRRAAGLD